MIEIREMKTSYAGGEEFSVPELTIMEGTITSIIGKNGSGKSTILKAMAGQLLYKGKIRIGGKECREYSSVARAREIAFLPQTLKSVNIDVKTLVEHGRYPYLGSMRRLSEKDRDIVKKALDMTGMSGSADRNLQELSGGERQKAYLSMVIAQDAKMILLDEPTTFMDVSFQESFYRILMKLRESGRGIVMVSHHLEQSFGYSDQICLMDQRMIVKKGSPEELLCEEDRLREIFGVTLKKTEDEDLLYPYVIKKLF